jgi:hypothetical protein
MWRSGGCNIFNIPTIRLTLLVAFQGQAVMSLGGPASTETNLNSSSPKVLIVKTKSHGVSPSSRDHAFFVRSFKQGGAYE